MCYRPITLKKTGVIVPCSKCPKCIARRVSGWSFRLMEEEKVSSSAHFLTLTYDTKHVPISADAKFTLCKRHLQLFFKRLRKSKSGSGISNIKYYGVGEYGGRTYRPHYHIILFNADLELIQPAWKMGHIYYGQVSGASVGYTLKYMMKHKRDRNPKGLQKEFSLMSKGLGVSYLNEANCNWHIRDLVNRMYCNRPGNIKIAMPRYYKDKLYFENERSAIRDAFEIKANEKWNEKLAKQTLKSFINEQKAIDAAFDKMYLSSQKIKL